MCLNKGKFSDEDQKVIRKSSKKVLCEKWFANHLKVIRNIANHFGKVIRNYPKTDSHFAMWHRLFPVLYI